VKLSFCRIGLGSGLRLLFIALLLTTLAACATKRGAERPVVRQDRPPPSYEPLDGPPNVPFDVNALSEPIVRDEPLARYGNHSPYTVFGKKYSVLPQSAGYVARGTASWYGTKFHGRLTSTREPYDMYQFTAAHKTLPLPSYARVTRLDTNKSIIVRINDRGPFVGDRLIDLSYAAAVKLGVHIHGTAPVEVRVLHVGDDANASLPAPRQPRPAQIVQSSGDLYVQVAAFSTRSGASNYRQRLRAAGFANVRIFTALVNQSRVWRVRVGPLSTMTQADTVRSRLRTGGFGEPRVLRKP